MIFGGIGIYIREVALEIFTMITLISLAFALGYDIGKSRNGLDKKNKKEKSEEDIDE